MMKPLTKGKLVEIDRDGAILTKKGETAAKRAVERAKGKEEYNRQSKGRT